MLPRDIALKAHKLKGNAFEAVTIKRYCLLESGVAEALIEMYLAGVSVRRVEDIAEAPQDIKVSLPISERNKRAYVHIEDWRNHPV